MSAHELDHVAFAVPGWSAAGETLHRMLGARFASGFSLPEFNPCQVALAEDMRLELLEPGSSPTSFIARFLSDNGGNAAPHHITFKVHDIHAAIARAQAAGIEPILVNTDHPLWLEAFLHPRDTGLGFLTQLVQTTPSLEEIAQESKEFNRGCPWPETETPQARVPVVFGLVADLCQAGRVLREVLGAVGLPPLAASRRTCGRSFPVAAGSRSDPAGDHRRHRGLGAACPGIRDGGRGLARPGTPGPLASTRGGDLQPGAWNPDLIFADSGPGRNSVVRQLNPES